MFRSFGSDGAYLRSALGAHAGVSIWGDDARGQHCAGGVHGRARTWQRASREICAEDQEAAECLWGDGDPHCCVRVAGAVVVALDRSRICVDLATASAWILHV